MNSIRWVLPQITDIVDSFAGERCGRWIESNEGSQSGTS